MEIPFNIPHTCIESAENIKHLVTNPLSVAKKEFTRSCEDWFRSLYPGYHALMVTSCTKAMELIALSLNIGEGDEIIMPSYGYVGVANSFANTGAKLVLPDIDPVTMNIDADQIEACITAQTKAVVIMHYAGVACDMETIMEICQRRAVLLIEDNAQGLGVKYKGKPLGSYGDLSCISFDGLKNISCSEGGVLLYKDKYKKQIEACFENGTNKMEYLEGKAPFYEWTSKGSNFAISEYNAAVLYPLLQTSDTITKDRRERWRSIYDAIHAEPVLRHLLTPQLLQYDHNGHIFYIKCPDKKERDALMKHMTGSGISCSFHYTPLHASLRSREMGYTIHQDRYTTRESDRLLRLPVYVALEDEAVLYMVNALLRFYEPKDAVKAAAVLADGHSSRS